MLIGNYIDFVNNIDEVKLKIKMEGNLFKRLSFREFTDGRGELVPIEIGRASEGFDIPFEVKRCCFISVPTNENNAVRGKHAHRNLEQVIICMNGSFTLVLDNGIDEKVELKLTHKNEGIYIKDLIWRELKSFSENCVILVLSSQHYDEHDYIKDYSEFKAIVNGK